MTHRSANILFVFILSVSLSSGSIVPTAIAAPTAEAKKRAPKKAQPKAAKKSARRTAPPKGGLAANEFYVYEHAIVRGDTLGKIARRYGVTTEQIMLWNDLPSPHLIREGRALTIQSKKLMPQRVRDHYVVRPGDTLGKIAERHRMRVIEIKRMNGLRSDTIHAGRRLAVLVPKNPEVITLGGKRRPGSGFDPVQLTSGTGYHLRNQRNAWGTANTVRQVRAAFAAMHRKYKGSVIAIGDVSQKDGGPLGGHRSHQNGLDIDIGLYREGEGTARRFATVCPRTIDVERTWALVEIFLKQGQVDMMFLDYSLQKPLYDEARRRRSFSAAQLADIFQYPRGRGARTGVIRHEPGHRNHIHIRFFAEPSRTTGGASRGRSAGAKK